MYNPDLELLDICVKSIENQAITNFEVCVAIDGCDVDYKWPTKWKVKQLKKNLGISGASNEAAKLATGDFLVLVDCDDVLTTDALIEVHNAAVRNPNADVIYSDEDKVDGVRLHTRYSKSATNPLLLLGHNCISHIGAYRRSVFNKLGGFRDKFNGAQDWDLALRFMEYSGPNAFHHIPKVLYHWRIHPGSTAGNAGQKPEAAINGAKAVIEHMKSWRGVNSAVIPESFGNKIIMMPKTNHFVHVIIPTIGKDGMILRLLDKLKILPGKMKITVADNGIKDRRLVWLLKNDKSVDYVKYDYEFNYSRINNDASKRCDSEFICLLNDDIEPLDGEDNWLNDMLCVAMQPWAGIVGAKLLYPNNTVQHGGVLVGVGGVAGHAFLRLPKDATGYFNHNLLARNMMAVTGACMVMRRNVWNELNGLDEKLKVAFNDVDLCVRSHMLGYLNCQQNNAVLYHKESVSRGYEDTAEKKMRFIGEVEYIKHKFGGSMPDDPYFPKSMRG